MNTDSSESQRDFIRDIINENLRTGKYGGRVHTRFPPEPNGYLHIGHAKSICLNFGIAADYNGLCNLRFDDTNPIKEEQEYIDSIIEDVRWLGFDWEDRLFYASDYFERMYEYAEQLVKAGKAYVVPNPYYGSAAWDLVPNPRDPTGTHVDFMNMPSGDWTLKIYTVSGDLVRVLDNDGTRNIGQVKWDLVSRNGQDCVTGLYLYTVESGFGTQVGKFLILRD